jgi:hypothetical protein
VRHNGNAVADRFDAGYPIFANYALKRDGRLSSYVIQKLANIINGFRMRDFQKKPYYEDWQGATVIPEYVPPEDPGCLIVRDDDEDGY